MKPILLLFAIVALSFSSCKKDDVIVEDADVIVNEDNVDEILIASNWYIANATTANGTSNIDDYKGYTFNFEPGNALVIAKGENTELVGWQASGGNSGVKIEFEVPATLPQAIQNLGEIWYVTRLTESRLTMQQKDHSGQEITFRRK